jgi:hypothetical protein
MQDEKAELERRKLEAGGDLVFYYSRAGRLERASAAVRALNDDTPVKRPGLIRTLTSSRPNILLFISIIIISVFFIATSILMPGDELKLGGNTLSFSAFRYQGSTVLIIKKTIGDKRAYTGAVDVAVSPFDKAETAAAVAAERIYFTLEKKEEFRLSFPFEAPELLILLGASDAYARLRIKPE